MELLEEMVRENAGKVGRGLIPSGLVSLFKFTLRIKGSL